MSRLTVHRIFMFAPALIWCTTPAAAATHTVCASGCKFQDLQQAINAAQPGDTLILKAGETYRGHFGLPWKPGSGYITIQSSRADQLPPAGYRITPAHKPLLAVLQQTNRGVSVMAAGVAEYEIKGVDAATDRLLSDYQRFGNDEPIACQGPALPAPLQPQHVYYVRDVADNTFRLAAKPGDPPIDLQPVRVVSPIRCSQARSGHHYRFRGIEFTTVEDAPAEYSLVQIGSGAELLRDAVPHHIEFNQVYIHGRSSRHSNNVDGPRNCLVLNAAHAIIRDSYIAECKREGEESKGIVAWQSPGPLEIRNNYIEAASINILLGGARTSIPDLVIGDGDGTGKDGGVVITGNHLSKQLYWKYQSGTGSEGKPAGACIADAFRLDTTTGQLYRCQHDGVALGWAPQPACSEGEYFGRADVVAPNCSSGACWVCTEGKFRQVASPYRGGSYVVKALLEAKSLMNGEITGNVFENSWSTPIAVPMQVANPGYNWNRAENVLIQNNIIRNCSTGYHNGTEGAKNFTKPNRQVHVKNNLFHNIGMTTIPTLRNMGARPLTFGGECIDCSFEHNTVLSGIAAGAGVLLVGNPLAAFRFADNIVHGNAYGILGDGHGQDCDGIEYYTGRSAFRNNVLINNTGDLFNGNIGSCAVKTKYVGTKTELFVGEGNFHLKPTSPYSAACKHRCDFVATDGKDLGADIDEVEAATSGAVAGTPPWAEQIQLHVTATATAAAVDYRPVEPNSCSLRLFTDNARTVLHADTADPERQTDTRAGNVNAPDRRSFRLGVTAPLTPGTDYWYILQCRNQRIPGRFRTRDSGTREE